MKKQPRKHMLRVSYMDLKRGIGRGDRNVPEASRVVKGSRKHGYDEKL
jgi:hypothetical protein